MTDTVMGWSLAGWLFGKRTSDPSFRSPDRTKATSDPITPSSRDRTNDAAAIELLAKIRQGDEGALADLIRTYNSRLTAVALTFMGNRDAAMDVVQDAFVVLWEQRATLDIRTSVLGYLSRMVRNRALDLLKHERRRRRVLDAFTRYDLDRPVSDANAGEQAVQDAEATRTLWQAVQALPESPRRVFLLHWHARMTYDEIAVLLGVKVKTVRQLMYRAGVKLAERYRNV